MEGPAGTIGHRVLVIGMAGSGKSTFSRSLSAKTGLPVIHLDLYQWKPGWVRPSEEEWRETLSRVLAGNAWIADGNDLDTLELQLARADTVVLLETPWWTCASRAFRRGLSKPVGEMPEGCEDERGDACAMSGDWWGSSRATAGPRLNAVALSSRGTGNMQLRMCSVQSEQPKSFSTVWATTNYDTWDSVAKPLLADAESEDGGVARPLATDRFQV